MPLRPRLGGEFGGVRRRKTGRLRQGPLPGPVRPLPGPPAPRGDADDVERGEAYLARLRAVCETLDGQQIEREPRSRRLPRLAGRPRNVGIKIPQEYGGLGLSHGLLRPRPDGFPGIGAADYGALRVGAPVESAATRAGQDVRQRAAEAGGSCPAAPEGAITAFLLSPSPTSGPTRRRMSSPRPRSSDDGPLPPPRRRRAGDHERCDRGGSSSVMARVPSTRAGRGGMSTRFASRRPRPRASPSSVATRSWASRFSRTV